MSPQLSYQIARARQNEAAAATTHAHHRRDVELHTTPRSPITQRIARIVVVVVATIVKW